MPFSYAADAATPLILMPCPAPTLPLSYMLRHFYATLRDIFQRYYAAYAICRRCCDDAAYSTFSPYFHFISPFDAVISTSRTTAIFRYFAAAIDADTLRHESAMLCYKSALAACYAIWR